MKITMTPNLRGDFMTAMTCDKYEQRLIELAGSEHDLKAMHDDWARTKPAIHRFTTYCTIAFMEATADYTPSEKRLISFIHHYNIGEK